MSILYGSDWVVYSRKDPRFAYQGDGPMTVSALQDVKRWLEEEVGCRAPDDLTVYGRMKEEEENMETDIVTVKEMEAQMREMRDTCDVLAKQLQDAIVELRAVGIAVEKLKANVRYMQDEVIRDVRTRQP